MIYSISIHRPKPEHELELIDSMHRYGNAARSQPGLVEVHTLKARDQENPLLIGVAVWDSAKAKDAAGEVLSRAIEGDAFDEWETEPFQSFLLDEV
jgi:heme-degrading monooxygenase HmoA